MDQSYAACDPEHAGKLHEQELGGLGANRLAPLGRNSGGSIRPQMKWLYMPANSHTHDKNPFDDDFRWYQCHAHGLAPCAVRFNWPRSMTGANILSRSSETFFMMW